MSIIRSVHNLKNVLQTLVKGYKKPKKLVLNAEAIKRETDPAVSPRRIELDKLQFRFRIVRFLFRRRILLHSLRSNESSCEKKRKKKKQSET